ncbi:MAG: YebC/PmpR family DNA-binding transcriptional regulator [Clostridia bacterium]|nr:YebC/PmpR family DNA-binding transcriptional regulator [Clostridia bacterium]
MSGHSKWANIKIKKGKNDAVRGNIFTKIGRELAVAVKQGGPDPASNSKLRDVIAKAKQNNMPNDNITRSIKKASGELNTVNYEDMIYEGYGPSGMAVIVEALTDNKNRTAGDVRHAFDKCGGALGSNGCVSYLFKYKGLIVVEVKDSISEDDVMMFALDCGADDVVCIDNNVYEIYTISTDYMSVKDNIEKLDGFTILESELAYFADSTIDPKPEDYPNINRLINMLNELDDVQNVYHNINLPDEE